jgi:hypothetical protein
MAKKAGRIQRALAEKLRDTRSPLFRWLDENYAEIEPVIRVRRSWQALALTAKDAGIITGADNKGPSRQAVRKAWARVELARAASVAPGHIPTVAPSRTPTVTPTVEGTPHERRDPSRRRFEFSPKADEDRLLGDTKPRK